MKQKRPHKSHSFFSNLYHNLDLSSLFHRPSNSQKESIDLVNQPLKPQVLLSYSRGDEDHQEFFASCLYSSLREAGISVLKDDISSRLLRSITEGCEISIIVISKRYITSRMCLEELTEVMEFCRAHDQLILPIFYRVDPDALRIEKSGFEQVFRDLAQRISATEDEVSRWSIALSEAVGNYGFWVPKFESKKESEDIKNIVKRVRHVLDWKDSLAVDCLVGVSSQVQEVITMLQKHQSKNYVTIGIWGMAGIGKSVLAKLIFEHIQYEFESTCFLSNVREMWERKGKFYLQQQLFFALRKTNDLIIDEVEAEQRLMLKGGTFHKVLLVVDDVSHLDQLQALCGRLQRFGQGSRIIITTRHLDLLKAFQVGLIYSMRLLSENDSLQLLSRTAFKQASPEGEFIKLCRRMVAYSEGLPLALEVLGSFLYRRSLIEWESVLVKLNTSLPSNLYDILKLSFDSLNANEKEIFLNIVVFYIGEDMNDVMQKLDGCGCNASIGIRVIEDRSLVTIDENNKLRIHNVLQLMGRQIIRESSKNELSNRGHRYEVFLSFRGEDTRTTFTSHLYSALCNAGISVFKDDIELPRGNHIKTELLQAIGSSKIAIIIFSREYAASIWCLEELSLIMELHKSNGQVVLPVFYDVDPSEIRKQTSDFGEAFEDLIQRILPSKYQVSNWRTTLAEAGGIAGFVVLGSSILDKKDLFVADHLVGVDIRVQQVITMLQIHQSQDVVMVGIWGMGGIGKTTVAKAIYNEIGGTFESRSYLSKIREVWNQEKDQVSLQNQLLSEICKTTNIKINSIESGKITLSDRLQHKKALVVLDDVDESAQLNALVGSRHWFKPGSIIIITTRNQRLLMEMDCAVYLMKNLDEEESIKLFSWHAFKQEHPKEDFIELSRDIAAYSGGLPLALEVLGSYLFDREAKEWESVLEKLKKIPNDKIHKKLKISFDGLDDLEKEIFLDISCFFIGKDENEVTQILNGCGFFADIGVKTLVERSLININEKNILGMHDLLRDMGREIVREQCQKVLGKRSRLWFHEDALVVLLEHMGTDAIEGLFLNLSQSEQMHFQVEAFKMMKRLRLLHLDNVQLKGDYEYISRNLRWLCWHGFPMKSIPSNLYQKKLVSIDLKYSSLTQIWKESLLLDRLKILNLSHSHYLVETPDFSKLPNLEKLILKDCPSLSKVHHSIGFLEKILLLDLEDCIGLRSLPRSIYRLKCLKVLILSGCVMIEKLEEDIEQMESLTTLIAPTIKQVPFSLVRLKSILYLSICGQEGLSNHVIPSLYRSWISPTNNPLPFDPIHVRMPCSVLSDMPNSIHGPSTIHSSVPIQRSLLLEDGLEIHDSLSATNYISMLEDCLGHVLIQVGKNSQVFHTLSQKISQGLHLKTCSDDCILPGDNYPYWLTFKGEGTSVKFKVPPVNDRDHLIGIIICSVCIPTGDLNNNACDSCIICLNIVNYTRQTTLVYIEDHINSLEEDDRKEIMSNLQPDEIVEVKVVFGSGFNAKKTAVYLIYNESIDDQMKPSTSGATNLTSNKHKCEEE